MPRTPTLLLVAALTFTLMPLQAVSQPAQQIAVPFPAGATNSIDPNELKQLKQVEDTYKGIHSFTAEFEEGEVGNNGAIAISRRSQAAFRAPGQLMLNTNNDSGPTHVVSDGKNVYVTYRGTPHEYTVLPCIDNSITSLGPKVSLQGWQGVSWLYYVIPDEGSLFHFSNMELSSVATQHKRLANRTAADEITCRWTSTRGDNRDWIVRVYTVGIKDHLLYQYTSQAGYDPRIHLVRYTRLRINPTLPDSMFSPEPGDRQLPLTYITSTDGYSVDLDKGSSDGIASGDELLVFGDESLRSSAGQVLVTQTRTHDSTAEVMMSLGVRPDRVCVIIKHHSG